MDISDHQLRRLLWEARVISNDPHHPVNDRRHPAHHQAVAILKSIEEQGRRLIRERTQRELGLVG